MQESVARQVRVAVKLFPQKPTVFVTVLTMVMVTFVPSQMSLATGGVNAHGVPHSTMRLPAQAMFGGVVSTTVTDWLQVEMLVQESVARHVRVAVKLLPQKPTAFVTVLTMLMVTFVPSQMSFATGGVNTHGVPHSTIELAVQAMFGGVVSTTVMVWLQVEMLVQESVARHVRVAVKLLPQKPTVFVTVLTMVMVTLVPSQMSLATGGVNTHGVPHSTMRLPAQLRLGGVVSTTVTF